MQMPYAQPAGFLAIPPSGKGSAVLVLHAWWGLNDTMRAFCTRLAESGFVAFAPDLYHGKVADNIADAETLSNALDTNEAKADIADATMFLYERAAQADRDKLEAALRRAGRPVSFYRYIGTGHWFFEPDRSQAFNQAAASLAWDRTLTFLRHSSTL